ncbi:MAG: GTP cyclohydrolase II [Crocinitomicaceae bacterium]
MKLSKTAILPTRFGNLNIIALKSEDKEHLLVFKGELKNQENLNFRIHSECLTSEVMGSLKCDCREQLDEALSYIGEHGGAVLYLKQEGRGIGLFNNVNAYSLQDQGLDTIDANLQLGLPVDQRDYSVAAEILNHFNVKSVRLLTNNPLKIAGLEELGITVSERIPIKIEPNPHNSGYIKTKELQMNHM